MFRQRALRGHRPSGLHCDCIMCHGAHAAIPVPLRLVEACSVLSAVVKISLIADLVAHVTLIGQAYQGMCVDIRNWLPVRSPPPLSSFSARLPLWAPLPRREPAACQVRSCLPALSASCSCSGTGVPEQEGCCRPPVLFVLCFSRDALLCCVKFPRTARSQTVGKSLSPGLKDSAWGSWSGKGQRSREGDCRLLS